MTGLHFRSVGGWLASWFVAWMIGLAVGVAITFVLTAIWTGGADDGWEELGEFILALLVGGLIGAGLSFVTLGYLAHRWVAKGRGVAFVVSIVAGSIAASIIGGAFIGIFEPTDTGESVVSISTIVAIVAAQWWALTMISAERFMQATIGAIVVAAGGAVLL